MQGVELEAIEVKFDRAPGMGSNQVTEIVGQLGRRQVVDQVIEVVAHAPDASGIGIDGFGLQALELEVLEVGLVALVKVGLGWVVWLGGSHAGVSSRNIAKSPQQD